jgi:NADPH:quinone reductase-like Zn-dependent oxidoreductase
MTTDLPDTREFLTGSSGRDYASLVRRAEATPVKHTRIVVTHYGGPDALRVVEEDCPEPKRGEVRVKVHAAGVALPDVMMREGIHPETPALPFTPGWDLVGVVDRLGDDVSAVQPGEMVAALPISGAYAEFVCLPQRELVPVPCGLDPAEAVSLILNYVTAYQMLHRSVVVGPGQRVLIHGASGGVGTALLQLAHLAERSHTGPARHATRQPFRISGASRLTTSSRTSSARSSASLTRVSTSCSTALAANTSGGREGRCAAGGPLWPTV